MSTRIRWTLALVCGLLLAALASLGRFDRSRQPPAVTGGARADRLGNQDCRRCHAAVWDEWQSSQHAVAFSDASVQAAFQSFGFDRNCQSCHAPEPILAATTTEAVALREQDRASGVNCLSCHALKDGQGVAARHSMAQAPCRPTASAALIASESCARCHTSVHRDWVESAYRAAGKSCQSCHMPAAAERSGGFSHRCLGGHDAALVKTGAKMLCREDGDELVVTVTNDSTGHNFPGERHHRVVLLQVTQRNPEGEITSAQQELIKGITPFRGESTAEKIKASEAFEARFPIAQRPGVADVRLFYKLFPWQADRDAQIVHQATVELNRP